MFGVDTGTPMPCFVNVHGAVPLVVASHDVHPTVRTHDPAHRIKQAQHRCADIQ